MTSFPRWIWILSCISYPLPKRTFLKEQKQNQKETNNMFPIKLSPMCHILVSGTLGKKLKYRKHFLPLNPTHPKKFKEGVCCGTHLAVTYGGKLLYLQIFLKLSPQNNFELPFPREFKSCTHRMVNPLVTIMCADHAEWLPKIWRYNNLPPYVTVNMDAAP